MFGSFNSMHVVQVEPGTVIKQGEHELTVTDENAVTKGRTIYVTKKNFDALDARFPATP